MAASDYMPNAFYYRLHFQARPQMDWIITARPGARPAFRDAACANELTDGRQRV
jgi:hypothetical protein